VCRGKQLPSGSAEFYFRWLVGVNQEITSAQTAQRQFEICVFASLRQDFAWIFVTPDAPHSGALWHWSVEELMPLGDCFDGEINSISGLTPAITRRERNMMSGKFSMTRLKVLPFTRLCIRWPLTLIRGRVHTAHRGNHAVGSVSARSIRRSGMSHMTATRTYSAQASHEFTKDSGIATA
jgi:hypothetical protein